MIGALQRWAGAVMSLPRSKVEVQDSQVATEPKPTMFGLAYSPSGVRGPYAEMPIESGSPLPQKWAPDEWAKAWARAQLRPGPYAYPMGAVVGILKSWVEARDAWIAAGRDGEVDCWVCEKRMAVTRTFYNYGACAACTIRCFEAHGWDALPDYVYEEALGRPQPPPRPLAESKWAEGAQLAVDAEAALSRALVHKAGMEAV